MKIELSLTKQGISWGKDEVFNFNIYYFGLYWTHPKTWWPIYTSIWYDRRWRCIRLGPLMLSW